MTGAYQAPWDSRQHKNRFSHLQTPQVVEVINGVIEAEEAAIAHYNKLIDLSEEARDFVTQDLCIRKLADEGAHRIMFAGFLKEYSKE